MSCSSTGVSAIRRAQNAPLMSPVCAVKPMKGDPGSVTFHSVKHGSNASHFSYWILTWRGVSSSRRSSL